MKRIITFLLLFAFVIPYGASAQLADILGDSVSDGQISLKTDPEIPYIFSTTNVLIERNSLLDFSLAQITWIVNGSTIGKSGVGADTYSLYFNDTNPVDIAVRVQLPDGHIYTASKTITPYSAANPASPNEKLGLFRTQEPAKVRIRTIPATVRAFQRVEFVVEPIDKKNLLTDKVIYWYVNGKDASPGLVGDTTLVIRLMDPSASTTVSVNVVDGIAASTDSVSLLPLNDPRLRFNTSQATRVLYCISNAARMVDSDINRLKDEEAMIEEKSTKAVQTIETDIAFLTNTIEKITKEAADSAAEFVTMAVTVTVSRPGDSKLISIAKNLRDMGKYILDNPVAARLKYVYNRIEYYTRLINWFNSTQYRIQAEIKSAASQIEYQKKRCIDMANKKPDFGVDTGKVNDFKKFEW